MGSVVVVNVVCFVFHFFFFLGILRRGSGRTMWRKVTVLYSGFWVRSLNLKF